MNRSSVALRYEDYVSGVRNWNAYYKKGVLRIFFMSLIGRAIVKNWDEDFMQDVEKRLAIGKEIRDVFRVALFNVDAMGKRHPELEKVFA